MYGQTNRRWIYSTIQNSTLQYNTIQNKLYEHGSSEACFHTYSLLMIKENVQSIHLEFPCWHCRRQTSGTLYSSTTSSRAGYSDLLWNVLPELLEDVDLETRICLYLCTMVFYHIFFLHVGNTWACFWNNEWDEVDHQHGLLENVFKFLRFLSLGISKVYCLYQRSQWWLGLAAMKQSGFEMIPTTPGISQHTGSHCSDVQPPTLSLKVDTSDHFFVIFRSP